MIKLSYKLLTGNWQLVIMAEQTNAQHKINCLRLVDCPRVPLLIEVKKESFASSFGYSERLSKNLVCLYKKKSQNREILINILAFAIPPTQQILQYFLNSKFSAVVT